jgi:hypothetical protein
VRAALKLGLTVVAAPILALVVITWAFMRPARRPDEEI